MSNKPRNFSRRDFFSTLLGRRSTPDHKGASLLIDRVARPPGALAEDTFRQLCEGCGLCVAACPNFVIQLNGRWPELCLDYNHCLLCNKCSNACPTGALLPAVTTGLLPLFSAQCRSRLLGYCELCVESCPAHAISCVAQQKPTVDTALCNGCGVCRANCPANAISWQCRN